MYNANTTSYVQQKRGKGDYIYGVMNKNNYADLSAYNKMTIIATPGTPLTLTFNHEVDEKEALTDYAEADAGKYVWIDAVVGEDGKYEVDLSQYDVRHLNYIRIPWGYEKQSYIWYILLSNDTATAINSTKANAVKGEVFNLAGQKLAAPVKGFNIIDGKKVLVK